MSYSVNPSVFKSIFAVPTDIIDKHIRLVNGDQLKVLLWILRNSTDNPDIAEMSKALKMNASDVADYLQYWVLTGILTEDGNQSVPVITQVETPKETKPEIKIPEPISVAPSKPSSKEIIERIEESPEIGHLFNEAQQLLGKTIGYDGQCTLLLLHDHYGLPTEVLFMMIDYCVSIGKSNYAYLEAVGKDWGTREIDTLDKAAEQISILKNANSLWKEFALNAGITNPRPTVKQTEYLRRWSSEWKFGINMIILAYEEMANHTSKLSMAYIDKILMNWHEKGFKKPEDIEKASEEQNSKVKPVQKTGNGNEASYDLDKFKEESLYGELKYERKKKQ
ncbi:MAG: DnaD domain protein [Clostridia bacterium]|nr:DnaD domain protein [Clostridia bacterium]MBR3819965.1 DnaD domain protein [Clostridia bacterium]